MGVSWGKPAGTVRATEHQRTGSADPGTHTQPGGDPQPDPGASSTPSTLRPGVISRYAAGSLGTGGFATLPGLVLVYYMTDTLGVAALMAGLIISLAKIWDVLIDPIIGSLSDRLLAKTGTRAGMMRTGAIALPICFILTFSVVPGLGPMLSTLWVLIAFILCATAFSLFQVPYVILPTELAPRYEDRTRLLTWRVVILTLAILLFGAGGPELRGLFPDNPTLGYLVMAVGAAAVLLIGLLIATSVAPKQAPAAALPPRGSALSHYRAGFQVLRRSQPLRALLGTFMLQGLATGMMLAGAQFVATWVLRSEGAVTLLFVALIAPALLIAPLWGALANRLGKERTFVYASALFTLACLGLLPLLWAPGTWVYLPVALAGAGYAGMQSLPMAMLPDVIDHDSRQHGTGHAGIFGGVWTAGETAAMAFGATVLTLVLSMTGYLESVGTETVTQPTSALTGIVLSFSLIPGALMVLSFLTLRRYPLRRADLS